MSHSARTRWSASQIDIHASAHDGKGVYGPVRKSYAIPYRSLVTDAVANLIVTGRPIPADHVGHSSLRRMAPGFALAVLDKSDRCGARFSRPYGTSRL